MKSLHHTTEHQSTNLPDRQGRQPENLLRFSKTLKFKSNKHTKQIEIDQSQITNHALLNLLK